MRKVIELDHEDLVTAICAWAEKHGLHGEITADFGHKASGKPETYSSIKDGFEYSVTIEGEE